MVKTSKAIIASLISAGVISLLYWLFKLVIGAVPVWMVFVLVFIFALMGMKIKW